MAKRFLGFVGLGSLLLFTGVGILAWMQVKQRVELHLRPAAEGTDPEAQALLLLGEEVKSLRSDLDQFTSALEESFQHLDQAFDEQAAARAAALAEAQAQREVIAHLGELFEAEVPATVDAASTPEPAAAPEPSTAAESKGFLSFRLPSKGFSFDDAQEWVLLDGLSRAGFDAKTTLHDFSAATTAVSGRFRTSLAHPEAGTSGRIVVRAAELDSQEKKRDEDMLGLLDATRFPDLVYEIDGFEPGAVDAIAGTLDGKVLGRMTIKGRTRELAMDVRASLDASKRLLVEGEAALLLGDYGVEAPNKLGLIKMEDEVKIWIALRARSAGRVTDDSPTTDEDPGDAR